MQKKRKKKKRRMQVDCAEPERRKTKESHRGTSKRKKEKKKKKAETSKRRMEVDSDEQEEEEKAETTSKNRKKKERRRKSKKRKSKKRKSKKTSSEHDDDECPARDVQMRLHSISAEDWNGSAQASVVNIATMRANHLAQLFEAELSLQSEEEQCVRIIVQQVAEAYRCSAELGNFLRSNSMIDIVCSLFTNNKRDASIRFKEQHGTLPLAEPVSQTLGEEQLAVTNYQLICNELLWTNAQNLYGKLQEIRLDTTSSAGSLLPYEVHVCEPEFAAKLFALAAVGVGAGSKELKDTCRNMTHILVGSKAWTQLSFIVIPWLFNKKWRGAIISHFGVTYAQEERDARLTFVCAEGDEVDDYTSQMFVCAVGKWAKDLGWRQSFCFDTVKMPIQHRQGGSACVLLRCLRLLIDNGKDFPRWKRALCDTLKCDELHPAISGYEYGVCLRKISFKLFRNFH